MENINSCFANFVNRNVTVTVMLATNDKMTQIRSPKQDLSAMMIRAQ